MQVDSIETPQNETLHELPRVAHLSPFLIILNRPLNTSKKMCGWNWVNGCCRAKTTHLQKLCFSKSAHFTIGTCCRNCILDYPVDFIAGPWAKKLTQHLIYCVITATWLLLWRQENCMWLRKAHHLTYPPTLYSEGMRQGYTVQSSENHVRPNKSIYRSLASELTSLPWLSADHSGV